MSTFLSRWTGRPEPEENPLPAGNQAQPDSLSAPKRRNQALAWSASPSLERIHRELDWAQIAGGKPVLLPAPGSVIPAT